MNKEQFDFISEIASLANLFFDDISICKWIGCQFALESDYGKSNLVSLCKNYCGMKNPQVRPSCSYYRGSVEAKWASYPSLEMCVTDYALCIASHKPSRYDLSCVDGYRNFIKGFYCPEFSYTNKIDIIYSDYLNFQKDE